MSYRKIRLQPKVLELIKNQFAANFVAVSQIDGESSRVHHQLLTPYSDAVEEMTAGLKETDTDGDQTTLFCPHVIEYAKPFEIVALSKLQDKPKCFLMKAEGLEAYLGVPIFRNGRCIAALQVMNANPKIWGHADIQLLSNFANLIEQLDAETFPPID